VQKWHGFARGGELSADQQRYILELIRAWIDAEMHRHPDGQPAQGKLFSED
jgi:hypothetical protein